MFTMNAGNSVKVDQSVAAYLATLASINLNDKDLASLTVDLGNIIKYIEQLGELDTSGVGPTFQLTGLNNVWREDKIQSQLPREDLLDLAPDKTTNSVKVPKVL